MTMRMPSGQKLPAAGLRCSGTESAKVADDGKAPAKVAIGSCFKQLASRGHSSPFLMPGQALMNSWLLLTHSSRCRWRCLSRLVPVPCRFPFNPLEIQYKDGVEDWDQQQGDESSDGQSADLGIAQGFPERAPFEGERK